jgi:hypothetical protein
MRMLNFALWQLFEIERWQPEISCQKIHVDFKVERFYLNNNNNNNNKDFYSAFHDNISGQGGPRPNIII